MNHPPVKSVRYWGEKSVELTIAAILAFFLMVVVQNRQEAAKLELDASEWFVVNSIYVPDHEVGANPSMIYDRSILQGHRGFWVVEAQRQLVPGQAEFFNECSGSGVDNYSVNDIIPDSKVTWEWFFGKPCEVPPGLYRIEMTKDIAVPGYPVKSILPVYSNPFRVYPKGGLPSLEGK